MSRNRPIRQEKGKKKGGKAHKTRKIQQKKRGKKGEKDKCDKKGGSPENLCLKSSSPTRKSYFFSKHKTSSQVRISLYYLY